MQRLALFIPLAIFLVLAVLFWRGLGMDPQALPSALVDRPVPDFQLTELHDERQLTAADLPAEPLLLNVWASWCPSCRIEHPYLSMLARQGVPLIGLNYKDAPEDARRWLAELGNPYRFNIADRDGRLGLDLGVYGAPETFVIDAKGVVRYKFVGVVDEKVWREQLKPVMDRLRQEQTP